MRYGSGEVKVSRLACGASRRSWSWRLELADRGGHQHHPEQQTTKGDSHTTPLNKKLTSPPSHTHFATMAANALNQVYRYAIPTAIAFSLASASIYDVKGGTRAVIFDRLSGVKDTVVNEGTHFLVPWLQRAIMYDVRTKPRNISTTTGSKDLQMVSLTLRVLHRPEVGMLPKIYQVRHNNPLSYTRASVTH